MIYSASSIYEFIFKILIIIMTTFFFYKKKRNYKKWFITTLISPYFSAFSFIIIYVLNKKNKIDQKKENEIIDLILKYEIYIVFVSLLVLGVILKFSSLL